MTIMNLDTSVQFIYYACKQFSLAERKQMYSAEMIYLVDCWRMVVTVYVILGMANSTSQDDIF